MGAIFLEILMKHVSLFTSLKAKDDHLNEFLSSLGDPVIEDFDFPSGEYQVLCICSM